MDGNGDFQAFKDLVHHHPIETTMYKWLALDFQVYTPIQLAGADHPFSTFFSFVSNRRFDSVGLPIKPGSPETSGGKYEDVPTKLGKDVWNGSKCLQLPLDPPKRRDD